MAEDTRHFKNALHLKPPYRYYRVYVGWLGFLRTVCFLFGKKVIKVINLANWKFWIFIGLMANSLCLKSQNSFQNDLFDTWEVYHCELGDSIFKKIELLFSPDKIFFYEKIGTYTNWRMPLLLYDFEIDDYDWTFVSCNPLLVFDSIECLDKNPETCSAYLYEPSYEVFSKTKVEYENGIIY